MSLKELDIDGVGRAVFRHCTSPKALYVTLIERWWVLVLGCILGVTAGIFVIKGSQKKFMSKGRLLVYQKLPTFMDDSTRIPDPKAYDSLFATHVQLIGSPLIVEKAVRDFNLDRLDEIDELHANHRKLGGRTVGEMIRENLHVGRAGSGDSAGAFVLSVEYKHKSAKECPEIVEAILKTYRAYVNQSVLDDQSKAVQLLGKLKTKLDLDIQIKGDAYRDFLKSAPGIWDQTTKMNFHHKRVEAFEDELTQLEIKRKAVRSRRDLLKKQVHPETGVELTDLDKLALVDDLHLPRLEILISLTSESNFGRLQEIYPQMQEVASVQFDDLLTKLLELNSLSKNIGKQHPKYLDALADVEMLKSQLKTREASNPHPINKLKPADLVSAYEVLLEEELNHLDDRIEFVEARIQSEVDASKRLHDVSIRADQLKDEYDRASEISAVLLDKMQKQTVLSQFGSYVAEIIESPKKGQLVWPKKPVILVLCTICGFFLGTFSALLLDLIEVSPLQSLFRFLPNWLIRDRFPASGHPAS